MSKKKSAKSESNGSYANFGFEAKLWLAADKLRNDMDAAEYKHVVLGLIFLKYISEAFEEMRTKLLAGKGDYEGSDPKDADEYRAENVFWVPKESRWSHLQASDKQPTIGKIVDDAMVALERDNPRLKGVLPKDYARPALDKHRLGDDVCWAYRVPPKGNSNYALGQHSIHQLAPDGFPAFVLANVRMSSNQSGEADTYCALSN